MINFTSPILEWPALAPGDGLTSANVQSRLMLYGSVPGHAFQVA
jgi:hypothetical protein